MTTSTPTRKQATKRIGIMSADIQYAGHWKVPGTDEVFEGTLHYNEETRVLVLQLIQPYGTKTFNSHILASFQPPVISGKLFSGSHVTLLGCLRTNTYTHIGSHTTETIYADYALWGLEEADCESPLFRGCTIDYGAVLEWAGLCYYNPDTKKEQLGKIIRWSHEEDIELDVTGGLHLRFSPRQGSFSLMDYRNDVTFHQHIEARLFYDAPRRWQEIMLDVDWLRRLIELGKGREVGIREARYLHPSHLLPKEYGAEGQDRYEPADVLIGTEQRDVADEHSRRWTFLFNLSEAYARGALRVWFEKRSELEPVVDLYTLAYTDKIPSAMALFLNLMQALETYHARFVCDSANAYKKRVESLVENIPSASPDVRNFLCDSGQQGSTSLYLKSRISDLLYAGGRRPVSPKQMSFVGFPQKLVDTRNYYTHYSQGKKDKAFRKEELPIVNAELMALLEYHLMLTLGFDDETTLTNVQRRLRDHIG